MCKLLMHASTAHLQERKQNVARMHAQAADGLKRAQRGGMLTGAMLAAVASLLAGATRMQRNIISAAASSQEGGQISEQSPIWPIYAPIKVLATLQRVAGHVLILWPAIWSAAYAKLPQKALSLHNAMHRVKYWRWKACRQTQGTLCKCDIDSFVATQGLPAHQGIVAEIGAAIGEDMQVRDSASEDVRRTRNRCKTLEGRLRSILKGCAGEVSEQVGPKLLCRT